MVNHSQIKDTGAFFTIAPEARQVQVPNTHKVIGVVGDHLSEQLTFECPRIIDGHDISGCARHYVSWEGPNGDTGNDRLALVKVEGDRIYFTWDICGKLAAAKGVVQFSVHFEDIDEDGETVLYHWSTSVCKSCEILDGINHVVRGYYPMRASGSMLVIEEYNPVHDKTLTLDSTGIRPEGTLVITEPGVHNVGAYAQVDVDTTSGVLTVTENGTYDVARYELVHVDTLVPSGTLEITENGTYDVTGYEQVKVDVSVPYPATTKLKVINTRSGAVSYRAYQENIGDAADFIGSMSKEEALDTGFNYVTGSLLPGRSIELSVARGSVVRTGLYSLYEVDAGRLQGCHLEKTETLEENNHGYNQLIRVTDAEASIVLIDWKD